MLHVSVSVHEDMRSHNQDSIYLEKQFGKHLFIPQTLITTILQQY